MMNPMSHEQVLAALRAANVVAQRSLQQGHHPFGAVLVGPQGDRVWLEQGNVDTVNHAEAVLARAAAARWDQATLWACTLVTTVEPCAMCAGTQYWAHIGRLVYGISEKQLLSITGNHPQNPTLNLPSRQVFAAGQKAVEIIGPVPEVEAEIVALHRDYWRQRA